MTPSEYHTSKNEGPGGGCRAKDVHDEMRTDKYQSDTGEPETKDEGKENLMMPQTGEDLDF